MKNITNIEMIRLIGVFNLWAFLTIGVAWGQSGVGTSPQIIEKDGRHALLVDGEPFLILGGQAHNSSAWPGMLPQVWSAIEAMHANTLLSLIHISEPTRLRRI